MTALFATTALATAGPISPAHQEARQARNQAVYRATGTAEQVLATAVRHLQANNITRFNQTPGKVSVLNAEPGNTVPLVGVFGALPGGYLTTSSLSHGVVELPTGTRLLALAVDTDRLRLVATAQYPDGGLEKVYLTARHAALATHPATGASLLAQLATRLRELQDLRA